MGDSISRQFARWAANLTFEDLPAPVVDKIKALILLPLVSGVIGAPMPRAQEMVAMVKAEETKVDGATILIDGSKATRFGAVSANTQILKNAGLEDSFRMLVHPGPINVAVALTNGELANKTMKEVITALAAGYEFECRLAYDYTPSVSAHGFFSSGVFGTMAATMIAGKLLDLDEDGFVAAIAMAVTNTAGIHADPNARGQEHVFAFSNAARQGTLAAVMAGTGKTVGTEAAIEGEAGLYATYAGSHDGKLSRVFTGPAAIDLASVTEGLGQHYKLLGVMFRMYNAPGFDQPIIDLIVELRQTHKIAPDEIQEITIAMNYIETLFPRLEIPPVGGASDEREEHMRFFWSIPYHAAHAAINGGYPVVGGKTFGPTGKDLQHDKAVLAFMNKVRVIGVHDHPMFSPEIVIHMRDGRRFFGDYPYARLAWNFDQVVTRLQDCVAGLPGGQQRLDALVATMRGAEQLDSVAPLYAAVGTP